MPDMKRYFASTKEEAIKRYERYKNLDPFPDVFPALLSSAHIQAYIAKTGMIFPYFPEADSKKEMVTSASMIMTIGPEVLYWDSKDKQQYCMNLQKEDSITLRPNSITFLRPAERFNIPDYIAVRFNLRIVHVHRGLLLGTGPLLDPGYKGSPMIPVHNLTDNEYVVRVGDEFINVEFTKISNIGEKPILKENDNEISFEYKQNRGKTFDYSFTKFIDKNVPQRKVKSSLSAVIDKANRVVKKQKKLLIWSFVGGLIAIAALIYGGYQLTLSATRIMDDARDRIDHHKNQDLILNQLQEKIQKLEKQIDDLTIKKSTKKE